MAVPAPLQEPLTYAVPEALDGRLEVGMRVLVPLGRRRVTGVVVGFQRQSPVTGIKEVAEALDDEVLLDQAFLEMCRWAADYYVASLGEVLATALPPLLRTESRVVVGFAREPEDFHGPLDRDVLDAVSRRGPLTPAALSRLFPRRGVKAALDRLAAAGAVTVEDRLRGHVREARRKRQPRPEKAAGAAAPDRPPVLTEEQRQVLHAMEPRLGQGGFETMLLHGVTGSGKTEVYLQAMEQVRRQGRQSLNPGSGDSPDPAVAGPARGTFSGRRGRAPQRPHLGGKVASLVAHRPRRGEGGGRRPFRGLRPGPGAGAHRGG